MPKKPLIKKLDKQHVKYYKKKWNVIELLEYLAQQVRELKKNQCKPNIKCLFEAQKYMDEKY